VINTKYVLLCIIIIMLELSLRYNQIFLRINTVLVIIIQFINIINIMKCRNYHRYEKCFILK